MRPLGRTISGANQGRSCASFIDRYTDPLKIHFAVYSFNFPKFGIFNLGRTFLKTTKCEK